MNGEVVNNDLSKYDKFILNRILAGFSENEAFNVYQLVSDAVSYKCIIPSQNELIMETFFIVKEYLINNDFVLEEKEMSAYRLTAKGLQLKNLGSVEKFDEVEMKKKKRSIFHSLFFKNKNFGNDNQMIADYYE